MCLACHAAASEIPKSVNHSSTMSLKVRRCLLCVGLRLLALALLGIAFTTKAASNAPVLITQPLSQIVFAGNNALFNVEVQSVDAAPAFQWYFNGLAISNALSSSLFISEVRTNDAGE